MLEIHDRPEMQAEVQLTDLMYIPQGCFCVKILLDVSDQDQDFLRQYREQVESHRVWVRAEHAPSCASLQENEVPQTLAINAAHALYRMHKALCPS